MNHLPKILLALLLFACHSVSIGQNFAPLNAIWYYGNGYCCSPADEVESGWFSIEANRDTTINGQQATILQRKHKGSLAIDDEVIVREANDRIYFFENGQFKLLYDFNLQAGDTMTFSIPSTGHHYTTGPWGSDAPDTSKFAQVLISATATLSLDGQQLKVLFTTTIKDNGPNYFTWGLGVVTERLTTESGLFGGGSLSGAIPTAGFAGKFRCYQDNLVQVKYVNEDCNALVGIAPIREENPFSIYPNPALSSLTIEQPKGSIAAIKITAVNGQIILKTSGLSSQLEQLDIATIPPGIYFIAITDNSGLVTTQKFVKQ